MFTGFQYTTNQVVALCAPDRVCVYLYCLASVLIIHHIYIDNTLNCYRLSALLALYSFSFVPLLSSALIDQSIVHSAFLLFQLQQQKSS